MLMAKDKRYIRKKNIIPGRTVRMLSVRAISEKYDFHPNTIRAWVNRDGLRHVKHGRGGKIFIRQDDVERFIRQWYEERGVNLASYLAKLPFITKLKLLELVQQRYPELEELSMRKYPEYEGEVPLSWLLTGEQIEELVKEVKSNAKILG
jgi:DNA-binding transcriptional MerR regulator